MEQERPINKSVDERFHCRNLATRGEAVTRVRIYDTQPPTIIATELDENPGASITNMAEYLWPELVRHYLPERMEHTPPATFVEHYEGLRAHGRVGRDEYSRVTFDLPTPRIVYQNGTKRLSYGEPNWTHMSTDEVTRLVGHDPAEEGGSR
jgi:hypothetical protein